VTAGESPDVTRVPVAVRGAAYDVVVAAGVLDRLADLVPFPSHATRVALVTNGTVKALYGERVTAALHRAGLAVHCITVPDGEDAKTLDTLGALYHRFAAIPLNRDDVVVALGGGVVGDLAGFAAATWNRGVAVVQAPTTLLAQVDAAIGGKTGINLPEGKNLVGAFHQPIAVVADTGTLRTLPQRERRAGLGEVAKYGFIADPRVLELLESRPADAVAGDPALLADVVVRAAAVKGRVVAADERDSGQRALLNYGHTVGHAIEALFGYTTYRHGEAVGLGMVFAARLGERLGVSEQGLADRTVALLAGLGLPTGAVRLDPAAVWDVLARDKKARAGVRFVLCRRPGDAFVAEQPPRPVVDAVLATLT
jgi:3-dehydroquinate synthase